MIYFKYAFAVKIAVIKEIMMFENENIGYFLPFRPVYSANCHQSSNFQLYESRKTQMKKGRPVI